MSLLFMDGFAHYDVANAANKYNTVVNPAGLAIGSTYGRFGGCGMQIGVNSSVQKIIPYTNRLFIGFAINVSTLPTSGGSYRICSVSNGTAMRVNLSLYSNGTIGICPGSGVSAYQSGTTSFTLSTGVWYFIEFQFHPSTSAAAHDLEIKISGSVAAAVAVTTLANSGGSGTLSNSVTFGTGASSNSAQLFSIADVYILDDQGSVNSGYIGDKVVQTIYPTAIGSDTDFSVVGTDALVAVTDNPPDGDTSYVYSSVAGQKQSYTMTDLSGTPTIYGLQFNALSRKEGVGTRVLAPYYKIGGTNYLSSAWGRYPTYTFIPTPVDQNPATSANWLYSEVNALECGIEMYS